MHADTSVLLIPAGFEEQIVAAYNSGKLENFIPLMHPQVARCLQAENKDYFRYQIWWGKPVSKIPSTYKSRVERPNLDPATLYDKDKNPYLAFQRLPVIPNLNLYIAFEPRPFTSSEIVFMVLVENGKASLIYNCPTEKGLQQFRQKIAAQDALKQKVAVFWSGLDDSSRQHLTDMILQPNYFPALKLLQSQYKLSPTEAMIIVDKVKNADTAKR